MSISDNPESPFVCHLVDEFGTSNSSYVRDLVVLEAALREETSPPHDMERRYPLEALIIRNELSSGRATTRLELNLLRSRAAALALRMLIEPRSPRRGSPASGLNGPASERIPLVHADPLGSELEEISP
jgi:hypothetical protein